MAKAVKLADIAEQLGVSTVTVSKALSGQKGVSEAMREKIKQLADELGYKQPSAVKKEKSVKSYNIGVLVSEILRRVCILLLENVSECGNKGCAERMFYHA